MDILRTPDEQFDNLPDYPFAPHYVQVGEGGSLRLHYVDEGPKNGPVVLLMHGEPSWSYLYRFMIPLLAQANVRVLAPDLIGFGKSDKPAERTDYSYERHVEWMTEWFRALELSNVTLFCQDWGGLIGLRLISAMPDDFVAVVASNTGLPTGQGTPSEAFKQWLDFSQKVPVFPTGHILQQATVRQLTDAEVAAYDTPYPDESYKAGARAFPALVPISEDHPGADDNKAAWKVLSGFDKPFVTAFSDKDPITKGGEKIFQAHVAGAKDRAHQEIKDGGHFVQEDQPEALVAVLLATMRSAGILG